MSLLLNGTDGVTYNDGTLQSSAPVGRNLIINGNMQIAQRGTSASGITGSVYGGPDRFETAMTTAGTWTQSQEADAPEGFVSSLKLECTTADASLAAGDRVRLRQSIEAQNLQHLAFGTASAKSLSLSFWVKSNKTGTYIAELYSSDSNRNISKTYSIDSADTWEKKTFTYIGDTVGTINNDNGIGIQIYFWLGAGTDFTSGTMPTTWETLVDANRAAGQTVNLADTVSNYINITGVQLEVGTTATDFENLQYGTQLSLCQRYYYKSMQGTPANNIPTSDFLSSSGYNGYTMFTNTEGRSEYFQHPVQMRASPTVTIYSSNRANTAGKLAILIGSWVATTVSTPVADFNRLAFDITSPTSGVSGYSYLMAGGFDASAEL